LVDDEPALLSMLRRLLAEAWSALRIAGEARDGAAALDLIARLRPEVVFLDIQMPGMGGLEVARQLAGRCHVVFVTAHDRYAVQAFESAAVDYLLKPVDAGRLEKTVARLQARMLSAPPELDALLSALEARLAPRAHLQWLQVTDKRDLLLVAVEEVALFTAADKYTLAVTGEAEWVIRTPLKDLEQQLDPARFWRVHRGAIVRVGAIERVQRDEHGELVLRLKGQERAVPVSRAYAPRFKVM
jgi:DNA-binding LytR/AlgR family response regulator